jgi:hypothetical protein
MAQKVEVPAEFKDIADSALKFSSIAVAQWGIRNFVLGRPVSLQDTFTDNAMVVAGLALFHLVVDKMLVRVVVKRGEEGYYHAMQLMR